MELRSVETFLAVVEHGTFSRAAERLGYSQSAVTVQVARLERELGVRLFDRLPRGVALTEQGRAFVFHARELLGAAAAARASVSARPGGARELTGTLRVGAVESVSTALLPGLLARFNVRCPGVQVVVATERRERMVDGLRGNALDMLLTFEHHLCLSGLVTQGLRREAVCSQIRLTPRRSSACRSCSPSAGRAIGWSSTGRWRRRVCASTRWWRRATPRRSCIWPSSVWVWRSCPVLRRRPSWRPARCASSPRACRL